MNIIFALTMLRNVVDASLKSILYVDKQDERSAYLFILSTLASAGIFKKTQILNNLP